MNQATSILLTDEQRVELERRVRTQTLEPAVFVAPGSSCWRRMGVAITRLRDGWELAGGR